MNLYWKHLFELLAIIFLEKANWKLLSMTACYKSRCSTIIACNTNWFFSNYIYFNYLHLPNYKHTLLTCNLKLLALQTRFHFACSNFVYFFFWMRCFRPAKCHILLQISKQPVLYYYKFLHHEKSLPKLCKKNAHVIFKFFTSVRNTYIFANLFIKM
jgi:hypothetical protein